MDELLPCPFCGSPAALSFSRDGETCNVRCSKWAVGTCLGAGPNCYDRKEAAVGWNRRAAVAAQPEAGEAVALTDNDLERIFEVAGGKWNGDMWTIEDADFHPAMRSLLASAPTIQPTQPVQEREALRNMVESYALAFHAAIAHPASHDKMKAKAEGILDAILDRATPAQAGDAGEPSDGERTFTLDDLKAAFMEGFSSPSTYNDTIMNDHEECWDQYLAAIRATPAQAGDAGEPSDGERVLRWLTDHDFTEEAERVRATKDQP